MLVVYLTLSLGKSRLEQALELVISLLGTLVYPWLPGSLLVKIVLLCYWSRHLILPKGVIRDVEKLCMRFFLKGSDSSARGARVSWKQICLLKSEGGLGLRSLTDWSKACCLLLIKKILAGAHLSWILAKMFKLRSEASSLFCSISSWSQVNARWIWDNIRCRDRLSTKDRLARFGIAVDSGCGLCRSGFESRDHIFSDCAYAVGVWHAILHACALNLGPLCWNDLVCWSVTTGYLEAPKRGGKVAVPAKKKQDKVVNPLFEKRPKQFGIGGALPPKKDLHRFVKWPKVVRIQRKKRILKQRPEDKAAKKERLLKKAQAEAEGKAPESKKPIVVKYGLNHVTYLIEQNKAQLVVIAHDVDPIELVVWLPALCRKMEVPYCIVKGKSRLGSIVHKKTASVLCLTTVKNEDKLDFSKILEAIKANFNDKYDEYRKKWGGGIMGSKSQARTKAKEKLLAKEAAQRMT
ncbi:60S ribosomal protein L7a [Hibiscus syriacus]|uniref:60S ribosomal protein L7a n=1 Tax=Hibiscus syriacus TaxID=106335 RepID=A0A6A3A1V7_HIBSY|nr:60S ribosomal protein L7a [Hibiscus syriacus]